MKKKFLIPLTCTATAVAALTPLSALTSCGNSQYDKIAQTIYKDAIVEFVGSEIAQTIVGDSIDTNIAGITSIPRPSGNLDKIRSYLKDRLGSLSVDTIYENSKAGKYSSMWFDIPASSDGQNLPKVILQAHMDLVFAYDSDVFEEYYKGEIPSPTEWYPRAVYDSNNNSIHTEHYGTSLGADNGIGLAMMLSILKNHNTPGFRHGPIRCIITADEEEGMKGANALVCVKQGETELIDDEELVNIFDTPYVINIDNETLGEIVTSTAGGVGSHYKQNFRIVKSKPDSSEKTYKQFKVSISGLKGGHSGSDINNWYANAIKMAGEIMNCCDTQGILLHSIKTPGVEAYNSIPDKCEFEFSAPITLDQVNDACNYVKITFSKIYQGEKLDEMKIIATENSDEATKFKHAIDITDSRRIYLIIDQLWYGPYSWSDDEREIVKTSANVGPAQFLVSEEDADLGKYKGIFTLSSYSRSQLDEDIEYFDEEDKILCDYILGPKVNNPEATGPTPEPTEEDTYSTDTVYPGWAKGVGSEKLHDLAAKGFKSFGTKPIDMDIHGGVEPAWWASVYEQLTKDGSEYKDAYKDWSLTALGPTIKFCHNPKEELFLDSLGPTIKTIIYMLDHMAN